MLRSHTCGELRKKHIGKRVALAGWLNSLRIHGKLVFFDLRDRYGITQCVAKPDDNSMEFYKQLRKESVLLVKGIVKKRLKGQENKERATGEIEVEVGSLEVLSASQPTPFKVEEDVAATEELRLKYRYLDLRRQGLQKNIIMRHRVVKAIRDFMDKQGFLEIETPFLAKSTPEGARDFLVPSRMHKGKFYALPQSPQIYKQLLMIAGFDRYFQIVRCMRDEDLRADRQPEFTQFDMEMSFVKEKDIFDIVEAMLKHVWQKALNKKLKTPFPRMSYKEVMERYGTDKPDINFDMELTEITDIATRSGFHLLEKISKQQGSVKCINTGKLLDMLNNKELNKLEAIAKSHNAKGIIILKYTGSGLEGSLAKHFKKGFSKQLAKIVQLRKGDSVVIIGDKEHSIVNRALGAIRAELGKLIVPKSPTYNFLWITEFPLMEWSEEDQRWVSAHHPFTSPAEEDLGLLEENIQKVRSRSYDLVLNGTELGSGSIRISKPEVQERVFKSLGISKQQAKEKFGFFIEALRYGTPPHGGIALGLDRLIALIAGSDSIRDVIAFPKNKLAQSLMTGAPSPVSREQLNELGLVVKK